MEDHLDLFEFPIQEIDEEIGMNNCINPSMFPHFQGLITKYLDIFSLSLNFFVELMNTQQIPKILDSSLLH
jgi:hypothetical protein